jgi:lipopolysaccharide biosynthesis glycosyltransferase
MKEQLNIVVITNDYYVILLAALIKSIESNLTTPYQLIFNIVDDKVSIESKAKLEQSINNQITFLRWIEMEGLIPKDSSLPIDKTSYPLNIYMRFFIPNFIDESIERVLYLDVDMIFQTDISALFKLDFGDNVVAAVPDPRIKTFDNNWGGVKNYKQLGLNGDALYFNSGLLVMNLTLWRTLGITDKLIHCMNENIAYANYPDQYGLNVILVNQWLVLDEKWNHFANMTTDTNPFVIHFVQRKPIYDSYVGSKLYKEKFFFYLKMTEWKSFTSISEFKRIISKLQIVINKLTRLISRP